LRVGHVEQVNLRNRAGDVEKRVDATERGESLIDRVLGSLRLREIARDHKRFRARGSDGFRSAFEVRPVPRDKNDRREIARKANGRRPANALTCAAYDCD
jgi:hypothetical protein